MIARPLRAGLLPALLVVLLGAGALALPAAPASATTKPATEPAPGPWSLASPLARETVRPGARDTDVHHIAHVRELQLRLARLGLYRSAVDGVFGSRTTRAVRAFKKQVGVRAFKKQVGLPVTGTVGHVAWVKLIRRTTHLQVPARCRAAGWHMCVDRRHHEATLFHGGALHNSWLVRTGSADAPTRLGTHVVYWRDIDHVSSLYSSPMPWSQFFDGGEALHGSVMMMDPYVGHSHGCVNLYLEDARQLWRLTSTKRLVVTVHGAWS